MSVCYVTVTRCLARTIPQTDVIDAELEDGRAISYAAHYGKHRFKRIHLLRDNFRKGVVIQHPSAQLTTILTHRANVQVRKRWLFATTEYRLEFSRHIPNNWRQKIKQTIPSQLLTQVILSTDGTS